MRLWIAFAAAAVMLPESGASGQSIFYSTPTVVTPPPINWADPIVRISTSFRIAAATKDTESLNDVKAQEASRRTLYDMAQSECAILAETFKAECRLNTFTITSLVSPPNNAANSTMSGTAIYELKPRTQSPDR
jgi:hypothetical protein